jgi:hypothetical protein
MPFTQSAHTHHPPLPRAHLLVHANDRNSPHTHSKISRKTTCASRLSPTPINHIPNAHHHLHQVNTNPKLCAPAQTFPTSIPSSHPTPNPQLPMPNQGWVTTNLHPLRENPTFPSPNLRPLQQKPLQTLHPRPVQREAARGIPTSARGGATAAKGHDPSPIPHPPTSVCQNR